MPSGPRETSSPRLGFSFAKTGFHRFNSSITRTLRNTIRRRMRSENAYLTRPRNLSRCKIEQSSDDVIPRPRFALLLPSGNREGEESFQIPQTFSFLASFTFARNEFSNARLISNQSSITRIDQIILHRFSFESFFHNHFLLIFLTYLDFSDRAIFVKLSFVRKLSPFSFLDFINSIYIFRTNSKDIKIVNMEDRGDSNQFLRFVRNLYSIVAKGTGKDL